MNLTETCQTIYWTTVDTGDVYYVGEFNLTAVSKAVSNIESLHAETGA